MKKQILSTIVFCFMFLFFVNLNGSSVLFAEDLSASQSTTNQTKTKKFQIGIPVGFYYSSTYWWRGFQFYGNNVGMITPYVGLSFGDTGLSLTIASDTSTNLLRAKISDADFTTAKSVQEFDFILAYSTNFGKYLAFGAGAAFYYFPFSTVALNGSLVEFNVSLGVNVILNPTVTVYYDIYPTKNASAPTNPQFSDFYVKLSINQEIVNYKSFTLSAGAWAGYYNDPWGGATGFSDAGAKLAFGYTYKDVSFGTTFYYAASLTSDFQGEGINHFWTDFSISYTFKP